MDTDSENSVYLRRLWSLYFFLLKLFIRFIFYGRLSATEPENTQQLRRTISKGPVAHRGGYPEHTLTGFSNCLKHGVSVLEVDLNFTSDGHLILFHDYTVDRTTTGNGILCHKTLAEVKTLDVGIKYRFPNNRIITLIEAVAFAKENNLFLILDVKGTVEKVIPVLTKLYESDPWLTKNTAVVSFFPDIVYYLKVQFPQMYTGLSCCSTEFSHEYPSGEPMFPLSSFKQTLAIIGSRIFYFILMNWIWSTIGVSLLLPSYADIQSKRFQYQYYIDRNVTVLVWTINEQRDKEHVRNVLKLPFLTDKIP